MATLAEPPNLVSGVSHVPGENGVVSTRSLSLAFKEELPRKSIEDTSKFPLLPQGAFDTHMHIFDTRLGLYSPSRSYTPGNATLDQYLSFNCSISVSLKCSNFVIVQPSPYRNDNQVLLSVLEELQQSEVTIRAIAVVDIVTIEDQELRRMHELGVRGLRLNLQADGHDVDVDTLSFKLKQAANKIQKLPGWMLQLFCPARVWEVIYPTLVDLPVVIIADHTGGLLAASKLDKVWKDHPTQQPGFEALVQLARISRVKIKISGLYRSSSEDTTNFADMEPLIRELAEQVPDSLIWASDWPHTGEGKERLRHRDLNTVEPFRSVDNVGVLRNLKGWVDSEETWMKMMVHNPMALFQ